uniref:Protein kinase domain-containing protein n=1 Tax=Nelumbo nucifera TaxID=4432 RepID=A0A822ZPF7_NELNU|nr:TPA_asm: hypothetical protein HUJ06_003651 [Nelumbo nucifera]
MFLQSPKLLSDFFYTSIFFLLLIPSSNQLTFNFSRFDRSTQGIIRLERDAHFSDNGLIELNELTWSSGQASYKDPVRLWDNTTGNLTDFTTQFSFTVDSMNDRRYADGLAFFLAPYGFTLPSSCCNIGIFKRGSEVQKTANQIVAVEFDTYGNYWDPIPSLTNWNLKPYHVGIDINSSDSVVTGRWTTSLEDGKTTTARISFSSTTKRLSISWTYANNPTLSLSYEVDLKQILPEWVTVGFAGSTGTTGEFHRIHSWDFYSSLEMEKSHNSSLEMEKSHNSTIRNRKNTGLVVGVVVGGGCLALGLGLVCFILWMKRKRDKKEEQDDIIVDDPINVEFEKGTGPKMFLYRELAQATNNFAEEQKLGEGGFGGVYRGFLRDLKVDVAVKRVSKGSKQGLKE